MNGEESEETKKTGLKYFDILVKRSFFLEVEVDESGKTNCKIHDIIHDFLLYMTKNYFLIVNDGQPFLQRVNEKVRHLTLTNFKPSSILDNFHRCENLRTLVVWNYPGFDLCISQREIVHLKYVRTLTWIRTGIKAIPMEIIG